MKLTIIPSDKTVYKDGGFEKELLWSDTPTGIHALQWEGSSGWIEFTDDRANEAISELPQWALNAVSAFEYSKANPAPIPLLDIPSDIPPTKEELLAKLLEIQAQLEGMV